jgi:hypothetical protein
MDPKELLALMEAYHDVYAPQQIDELSNRKLRAYIKKSGKSHAEINKKWDQGTATDREKYKSIGHEFGQERAFRTLDKRARKEDFEFWVDSLIEEGYDLSDYTWDEMLDIYLDEAEGSYGQTPKARAAMGKVAIARREKPASEYSQKGEKTRKVKEIEKHTRRIDNGPNVGNRGKRSTSPRWSGYLGATGRGKMDQDSRDYARDRDVEYSAGGNKPGPGTVTKNPKKLRKQKAMGEIGESYDIFDVVLEFLQAEGFAETLEEAEWMMANELDDDDIDAILEAEGSYGQTPKARTAMSKLTIDRMRKPASEYSQRGEKTRKVKAAEKQTRRQDVLSRGLSGGKKSSRPSSARGKMDADERSERRAERAFDLETTYGSGSVTKNPKKLRKQKAMGEHD